MPGVAVEAETVTAGVGVTGARVAPDSVREVALVEVVVGDAAGLVRAFKGKGVTSAILTGLRAADVILHQGISAAAFRSYHIANSDITGDLSYGQMMRRLTILAARFNLVDPVLQAAEGDPGLRQALFDAVSAHRSYREVIHEGLSLASGLAIAAALARLLTIQ